MTYQWPAYEEVTIAHGGETVTLRPSLRAAVTLEARYGFPALFRALDEWNLTIISEIILSASSSRQGAAAFLLGIPGKPLFPFFMAMRQPLVELVSMFMPAPVQPLDKHTPVPSKPIPLAEIYGTLYNNATGWLGWTPETAWNATPTEIARAYDAHIDRLVTTGILVCGKQPTAKTPDLEQIAGLDPEFDRAGLRALKAKITGGA